MTKRYGKLTKRALDTRNYTSHHDTTWMVLSDGREMRPGVVA